MLRYDRQTKSGLVALYDIRPGNGAGPFLQSRSPHGAKSLFIRVANLHYLSASTHWCNDNVNNQISIVPYGRNFRGTGKC